MPRRNKRRPHEQFTRVVQKWLDAEAEHRDLPPVQWHRSRHEYMPQQSLTGNDCDIRYLPMTRKKSRYHSTLITQSVPSWISAHPSQTSQSRGDGSTPLDAPYYMHRCNPHRVDTTIPEMLVRREIVSPARTRFSMNSGRVH